MPARCGSSGCCWKACRFDARRGLGAANTEQAHRQSTKSEAKHQISNSTHQGPNDQTCWCCGPSNLFGISCFASDLELRPPHPSSLAGCFGHVEHVTPTNETVSS